MNLGILHNMSKYVWVTICESLLQPATLLKVTLLDECFSGFLIIIIISLFNVDAKSKVKNYNKKEIIVYIINYNI